MSLPQPGILPEIPPVALHLLFDLATPDAEPVAQALRRLSQTLAADFATDAVVVGLGSATLQRLGQPVPGLRDFPELAGAKVSVPATPRALWLWLRGEDAGELWLQGRRLTELLAPSFMRVQAVAGFCHRGGRDLTGYEDGTENPEGDAAVAAALVAGQGPGLDGGSFAVLQQWVHQFDAWDRLSPQARDHVMGRRLSDNEELDDAPASAHVKRTAQESFSPEAFLLRRSMPWAEDGQAGLMFLAFACDLRAFEVQMRRMAGLDDGVVDGLFGISRPVSGATFWCPPLRDHQLDWRAVGL